MTIRASAPILREIRNGEFLNGSNTYKDWPDGALQIPRFRTNPIARAWQACAFGEGSHAPGATRVYLLNHAMVRLQASSAAALL